MTTLTAESLKLSIDAGFIELFVLDCSMLGGEIHRFTPNVSKTGFPILWQGQQYMTLPITTSGWEYSSDGSQKKPQLMVSNITKRLQQAVIELGDVVGAELTRYRTFSCFLDGESSADPTQYFPPDHYIVEQKLSHDNTQIVWSLCSPLDSNEKVPARQVTKDGNSRWGGGFPAVGAFRPIRN